MSIDVHCHIDQLSIEEQAKELKRHRAVGVAVHYQSGETLLRLQNQYPETLKVCLGIHPEHPDFFHEYDLVEKQIRENHDRICGIGEIGLPYFHLLSMNEPEKTAVQKKAEALFEKFAALAGELNLPLNLHCVENTAPKAIELLKKYRIKKALFHWFEGDEKSIKEIRDSGWNISVSLDLTVNLAYRTYVTSIAPYIREIFTLESDGPWEFAGKRGMPSDIEDTASILAEILQTNKANIIELADRNAKTLFG